MAIRLSLACLLAVLLATLAGPVAAREIPGPVTVGIIAFNDFHGNLEPPRHSVVAPDASGGVVHVPAGGAAWLASAIDSLRTHYTHHLTVSAGDLIGASPLASSLFLDEPTVEVMNRIGLDYNAVGNHEFDRGRDELLRIAHGGCARFTSRPPCAVEPYRGARFTFLAANTLTESGAPLFPATALRSFGSGAGKVTVGMVGVTLKATGDLVARDRNRGLRWADEAEAANALVPRLKAEGADVVVLLIHQGGRTRPQPAKAPDSNRCDGLYGDIIPILDRLDARVDIVISGHTHSAYVCDYSTPSRTRPLLLTSAGMWGEQVTDLTLTIDPVAHRLVGRSARNVIVQSPGYQGGAGFSANGDLHTRFEPRADISGYVARYVEAAAGAANRTVGWLGAPAPRTEGRESNTGGALGRLIADAQLAAARPAGAEIAFMNPFGVRTSLVPAADGSVTFGKLYAVQPFNNVLVTQSLSGAEIKAILEQGFDADGPEQILTPSAGFAYSYDRSRPEGSRIVSMSLNGRPIQPERLYRVTTSDFLANGGDTFTLFTQGRDRVIGIEDVAALEQWLRARPPRRPPEGRREIDLVPASSAQSSDGH